MKFILKSINEGKYCLLFTPALMGFLYIFYFTGKVNENTELHPILAAFIDWRYSESGFSFFIVLSCAISFVTILTIRTQQIPKHEKILLSKTLNIVALFMNNMFLFWAGVFIAWSFGSRLIPFIPVVPTQEFMAIFFIPIAIWIKYQIIKLKHWAVNG